MAICSMVGGDAEGLKSRDRGFIGGVFSADVEIMPVLFGSGDRVLGVADPRRVRLTDVMIRVAVLFALLGVERVSSYSYAR